GTNTGGTNTGGTNTGGTNTGGTNSTDSNKPKSKTKYEKRMNEIYGEQGALFSTKYSDERIAKNSGLEIGQVLINEGNTLVKNPNSSVIEQGKKLIKNGENLKKTVEGDTTITFDEQEKKIGELRNGKERFDRIPVKRSLQDKINKYLKDTSKEEGDKLDDATKTMMKELVGIQTTYDGYDQKIQDLEQKKGDYDTDFSLIVLEGKKFEEYTDDDLKRAAELVTKKLTIQSDIATIKQNKINDITKVGSKLSLYYNEHGNFIDLIKAPLSTQVQKLNEGKTNITNKIQTLKGTYTTYQSIIDSINNRSYQGNIDNDLKTHCSGIVLDLSHENKESILVQSLSKKKNIIAQELQFYVKQLNGNQPDYTKSLGALDTDVTKETGGINKDIKDLNAKIQKLDEQKALLDNSKTYINQEMQLEVDILKYDQAVDEFHNDIESYKTISKQYIDAENEVVGKPSDQVSVIRDKQRALQWQTYQETLSVNIMKNKKIITDLGDGDSIKNINLKKADKLIDDTRISNTFLNTIDVSNIKKSENLIKGKIIDEKRSIDTTSTTLKINNAPAKLSFELINPVDKKIISISKAIIPTKDQKQIPSSEKIMTMYNTLNGENTTTVPPTPAKNTTIE
ncbi:MAG TPA: hypothetical protein PLW93_00435, partial [Candidatus Absconditabacterales bacterium]|nr:hypothetical protein [Candidatus Absconditabacterales bacterium]HNG96720.1 hypothetical protein [Candidatus Absconditabacterales bacterium]